MSTDIGTGFNINTMFAKISETIDNKGVALNKAMNAIGENEMSDSDMLKMQFMVNQYNTLLEAASTITKALVDEAKQIAQRAS